MTGRFQPPSSPGPGKRRRRPSVSESCIIEKPGYEREYVVAFTEDVADCLICTKAYFVEQQCKAFESRKPYPRVHEFKASCWQEVTDKANTIFKEALAARKAGTPEPPAV